jgi:hypothetical protein
MGIIGALSWHWTPFDILVESYNWTAYKTETTRAMLPTIPVTSERRTAPLVGGTPADDPALGPAGDPSVTLGAAGTFEASLPALVPAAGAPVGVMAVMVPTSMAFPLWLQLWANAGTDIISACASLVCRWGWGVGVLLTV